MIDAQTTSCTSIDAQTLRSCTSIDAQTYVAVHRSMLRRTSQPLAERLRPKTLDDYIGQKHLVGQGAVLRKMIDAGRVPSFILWGPPGVGKTTLAQIIANKLDAPFYTLSAISSGVKDVREVIEKAKSNRFFNTVSPILFIDEIHRFSKSQQDSLLTPWRRAW